MDIQFNKVGPNHGEVSIILDMADYGDVFEKEVKHYAQNVRFKGFRLGAPPLDLVRKRYGTAIVREALTKLAEKALNDYLKQEHIVVFVPPLLVKAEPEGALGSSAFVFSYELAFVEEDEVQLGPHMAVTAFEIEDEVAPNLVDALIEGLQLVHGQSVALEASTSGALLEGTFKGNHGILTLRLRVVVDYIPQHLRDSWLGLGVDSTLSVTEEVLKNHAAAILGIDFPTYACLKKHEVWPATFTVDHIMQVTAAPLEPALFNRVLGEGVVDTLDGFREALSEIILFDKRTEANYIFYEDLRSELFKYHAIHLPEAFLKRWLATNNPDATSAEIAQYYSDHEETLKWEFLLGNIVRKNGLAVDQVDVFEEAKQIYLKRLKDHVGESTIDIGKIEEGTASFLSHDSGKNYIKLHERLSREKAIDFIKKHISFISKKVTIEQFDARMQAT